MLSHSQRKRYERILQFISNSIDHRGKPPTNQEIADFLGTSSVGTVGFHLKNMEKIGMLQRSGGYNRGIHILGESTLTSVDREVLTEMKNRGVSLGEICVNWRTFR